MNESERKLTLASWNVNSLRARLPLVLRWLERRQPDVLFLQELKGIEFPSETFESLGYRTAAVTQKTYNGVAILSRDHLEVLQRTLPGDEQDSHARYLEVRTFGLRLVNAYLPNGNPVGTAKFEYKLSWMERLRRQMAGWLNEPAILGGDLNVIPEDLDCHKPSSWVHDALFQPETRALFQAMLALGYTDAFRELHPGLGGQFTYWDYFRDAFAVNRGVRIDHFLLSPPAAQRLLRCEIDREPRAEEKPSDHTPIVMELAFEGAQ